MDWSAGYREFRPPAALCPAVSCLWVRVVAPDGPPSALVLPDACADLIWASGRGVFVAGPDTGPVTSPAAPGTVFAGLRLRPGAGGPALGIPLTALLDQRVDAADLCGDLRPGPAAELARPLPGSLAPETAMHRLIGLAAAMVAASPPDPLVAEAARRLGRPGARVDQVAAELGAGERQLRRRCRSAVGYGPAALRRVLRFRRFVSRLDAGGWPADPTALAGLAGATGEAEVTAVAEGVAGVGLAGLAAAVGYADQAHLTRECTRLAGLTPAALAWARNSPRTVA